MAKNDDECLGAECAKDSLLLLGGALIGAAAALLYAPQTGAKTRKQLTKKIDEAKGHANDVRKDLLDKVEDLRDTLSHQIEDGAEYVGEKREALSDSIESLQDKINDIKKKFAK